MAEQQNINQFGREELIDILQYLYVQGSQILYYPICKIKLDRKSHLC
ncbi:hypothetical protein ACTGZQ_10530 [Streptococcus suis]